MPCLSAWSQIITIYFKQSACNTRSLFAGLNLAGLNSMKTLVRATRTGFGGTEPDCMLDSMATSRTLSLNNCFCSASNLCIRCNDSCQSQHTTNVIYGDNTGMHDPLLQRWVPYPSFHHHSVKFGKLFLGSIAKKSSSADARINSQMHRVQFLPHGELMALCGFRTPRLIGEGEGSMEKRQYPYLLPKVMLMNRNHQRVTSANERPELFDWCPVVSNTQPHRWR